MEASTPSPLPFPTPRPSDTQTQSQSQAWPAQPPAGLVPSAAQAWRKHFASKQPQSFPSVRFFLHLLSSTAPFSRSRASERGGRKVVLARHSSAVGVGRGGCHPRRPPHAARAAGAAWSGWHGNSARISIFVGGTLRSRLRGVAADVARLGSVRLGSARLGLVRIDMFTPRVRVEGVGWRREP